MIRGKLERKTEFDPVVELQLIRIVRVQVIIHNPQETIVEVFRQRLSPGLSLEEPIQCPESKTVVGLDQVSESSGVVSHAPYARAHAIRGGSLTIYAIHPPRWPRKKPRFLRTFL